MVYDFVSEDHAIDQFCVELGQIEAILCVMLAQTLLASDDWLSSGQPKDNDVVRVLGYEAVEVTRVVSVELSLCERGGIKGLWHKLEAGGKGFFVRPNV